MESIKNKRTMQFFAFLLTMVLVVGGLPAVVFAGENGTDPSTERERTQNDDSSAESDVAPPDKAVTESSAGPPPNIGVGESLTAGTAEDSGLNPRDRARIQAQTNNVFIDLVKGNVPVGGLRMKDSWALANMLITLIVTVLSAFMLLSAVFPRRRWIGEGELAAGRFRVFAVVVGFITFILWLSIEDFSLPATWINRWTSAFAILFLAYIALGILFRIQRDKGRAADDYEDQIE